MRCVFAAVTLKEYGLKSVSGHDEVADANLRDRHVLLRPVAQNADLRVCWEAAAPVDPLKDCHDDAAALASAFLGASLHEALGFNHLPANAA